MGKTISTIAHSFWSVISLISFFPLHMIYINGLHVYQSPVYDINADCLIHIHKHPAVYMRREPPEMRQFLFTLLIITIQYILLKHHFKSSPGDFPTGKSSHTTPVDSSSGTLPRELFPGRILSTSPSSRDSEVPRIASPGFGKPPTTLVVFPVPIQRSVDISSTQKGRVSPNSLYPSD